VPGTAEVQAAGPPELDVRLEHPDGHYQLRPEPAPPPPPPATPIARPDSPKPLLDDFPVNVSLEDDAIDGPPAAAKPVPPPTPLSAPWTPPPARKGPAEPWYYGFVAETAKVALWGGGGVCVLLMFAGIIIGSGESTAAFASGAYLFVVGATTIIPVVLAPATVLMGVDLARNVRMIRLKLTDEPKA
jgi:hypothetical protein